MRQFPMRNGHPSGGSFRRAGDLEVVSGLRGVSERCNIADNRAFRRGGLPHFAAIEVGISCLGHTPSTKNAAS